MPDVTPRMLDPRFRGSAPALPNTPTPATTAAPSVPSAPAVPPGQSAPAGMAQRWEHLLRRSGLSREARTVGMVLTGYADRTGALGTATPGLKRMAARAELHTLTIRAALQELEREGWIYRDPRLSGPRGSQVHAITLLIPAHLQDSA